MVFGIIQGTRYKSFKLQATSKCSRRDMAILIPQLHRPSSRSLPIHPDSISPQFIPGMSSQSLFTIPIDEEASREAALRIQVEKRILAENSTCFKNYAKLEDEIKGLRELVSDFVSKQKLHPNFDELVLLVEEISRRVEGACTILQPSVSKIDYEINLAKLQGTKFQLMQRNHETKIARNKIPLIDNHKATTMSIKHETNEARLKRDILNLIQSNDQMEEIPTPNESAWEKKDDNYMHPNPNPNPESGECQDGNSSCDSFDRQIDNIIVQLIHNEDEVIAGTPETNISPPAPYPTVSSVAKNQNFKDSGIPAHKLTHHDGKLVMLQSTIILSTMTFVVILLFSTNLNKSAR